MTVASTGAKVRFGIVVFPGSNCEYDAHHALGTFAEAEPFYLWHKDHDLERPDVVVLPGGFSYGDYLRTGAIARFSPIMQEVAAFAVRRRPGLGHLQRLPDPDRGPPAARGACCGTGGCKFICHPQYLRVERTDTPFTRRLRSGR